MSRYEHYVKEHKSFNDEHGAFLEWLSHVQEELKEVSQIVGDLTVLQVSLLLMLGKCKVHMWMRCRYTGE